MGQTTLQMNSPPDDTIRRKRLLWRATHRGIKEMDLILGGFVMRNLEQFSTVELGELEAIMEIPDQEMLSWATRQEPVPARHQTALLARILDYKP
jgi:antitoxin CptB